MLQGFIDGLTAYNSRSMQRAPDGQGGGDILRDTIKIVKEALLKARTGASIAQSGGEQAEAESCAEEAFDLLIEG